LVNAGARGPTAGIGCGIQLVDRDAAIAAGLFDENLAHGWLDDGDLHHRLNLFGYRSMSLPTAIVVHRRPRAISRVYGQIHNRWYILLSHYQLRTLIVIAPALLIFELLLIGYVIRSGEARSYARALRDVAAKLPEIRMQRRRVQAGRRLSDKEVLSALDLDLPRHLRDNKGLAAVIRWLSVSFRFYWSVGLSLL
jgi:GT2 family glycosyltransferase